MSDSRSQSSDNPFAIVEQAASAVLDDANVDCATVTLCVGQQLLQLFPMLIDMLDGVIQEAAKAVNIWVYGTSLQAIDEAVRRLQARGISAHGDLDVAIRSLGCAARYSAVRAGPAGVFPATGAAESGISSRTIERARRDGRTLLTEVESKQLVLEAGIPVVEASLATDAARAVRMSQEMGFPVVLKIASPDVVHKSDAGGVRVGLTKASQVEEAYAEIMAAVRRAHPMARVDGISVQKMAKPGVEVIMGMSRDPQFGPTLMFGLGGVFTEVLNDVAFRVAPLDGPSAGEMIREIRGLPLLQGYRGGEPTDLDALEDILIKLSRLAAGAPEIKELDLNPVIARGDGAVVVDARVILEPRS
jgi:acyl-CoA synthetase (NDP forming)